MAPVAQRTSGELAALTRLTLDELGGAVAGIGQVHRAIAGRAFGASGPGATPARRIHDGIARNVYGGLRLGAGAVGRAAAVTIGPRAPISVAPYGAALLAAIDGLVGDVLDQERPALAPPMSSSRGRRASAAPAELPHPAPRLVVFLHGLMETEMSWRLGAGPEGETYGTGCPGTSGPPRWTCATARPPHLGERALAGRAAGGRVRGVARAVGIELIGHSMGGLVARSACHYASLDDAEWVERVRHVVSLGSPHMGAPLARAVHGPACACTASRGCRRSRVPAPQQRRNKEAAPRVARGRGLARPRPALAARRRPEVPLLEGATHCFVAATLTGDPRHPVGRLVGDLARRERAPRDAPATAASPSGPSTGCTWGARTTWRCSTTRSSTRSSRPGSHSVEPAMKLVFWISAGLLVYTQAATGCCSPRCARLRAPRRDAPCGALCRRGVASIVAAYNEEERDRARRSPTLLALDYPRERLEVIVASDGSHRRHGERARAAGADVVLELPRGGKIRAQDAAVERAARRARRVLRRQRAAGSRDALRALVAPFADPRVGYVCGQVALRQRGRHQPGGPVLALRDGAARAGVAARARSPRGNGAIYATRREAYLVVDPVMGHDLSFPFNMVKRGWRAVYAPAARATEKMVPDDRGRVRAQAADDEPRLADRRCAAACSPRAATPPLYALMIASHRLLRYADAVPAPRSRFAANVALLGDGWRLRRRARAAGRAAARAALRAARARAAAADRALLRADHRLARRRACGTGCATARRRAGTPPEGTR